MDPILSLAEIVGDFQPELSRVYHQRMKQVRDVARDAVGHSVPHGVHTGWHHGGQGGALPGTLCWRRTRHDDQRTSRGAYGGASYLQSSIG